MTEFEDICRVIEMPKKRTEFELYRSARIAARTQQTPGSWWVLLAWVGMIGVCAYFVGLTIHMVQTHWALLMELR